MSFDVSALSSYWDLKSKEIASKAIGNAQTAKLLIETGNVQIGCKGKTPVLKMDADSVFQDGSSCGRSASGNVTLSEAFIDVKKIKDLQNICSATLSNTRFSYAMKAGADPATEGFDSGFADYLATQRTAKVNEQVEKLIWQGDTSITGSSNFKYIDGVLKQAASGSTVVAAGSDMVAKLQTAYASASIDVKSKDDFRIFVGEDVAAEYRLALANKNIYQPTDDLTIFGTTCKIQPVAGLNGTRKIYGTRLSGLQLGVDGTDDADKASMRYSVETENWYSDVHFALGVAVVYPSQGYLATV